MLITVAGEQTGEEIEWALLGRNRRYWNGWQAKAMSEEQKADWIARNSASREELMPLTDKEEAAIAEALAKRCPGAACPKPDEPADLSGMTIAHHLICQNYIFCSAVDFSGAVLKGSIDFGSATFFRGADFRGTEFRNGAKLYCTTYAAGADFTGASFSDFVNLSEAAFSGHVRFDKATFSGFTRPWTHKRATRSGSPRA